jgi:xanthine dehydrogenase accessory factor
MTMWAEFTEGMESRARIIPPPVYKDYVLDDLLKWRREGLRTALVTLVGIEGASPRPLGSQIAVAEDGRAVGAVTGGCAEQAIVLDALSAMTRGENHLEIYGKGSRFKDIELPCGSGVSMYFDVTLDIAALEGLVAAHEARQSSIYIAEGEAFTYSRTYLPRNRLVILGRGHIVTSLAQMGHLNEFEILVLCPDEATRQQCASYAQTFPLISCKDCDASSLDSHTAVVSLFHDHDCEPDILSAALESRAFYIGALGSRRTHARRLENLGAMGWGEAACARIDGPAGLDIGAKTPPEIALSIMANIVAKARAS